jgi:ABC-type molybdenum transport system ATPase subunit/photorepair protein PhrA
VELAREGLEVLGDAPLERRAALLEMPTAPGARRVRRLTRTAPRPEEAPMTDTRQPAVVATAVRKSFGEATVLDGVDLTVAEGTIFALLGPNGAGKTTMLFRPDAVAPAAKRARMDSARRDTPTTRASRTRTTGLRRGIG